MLSFLAQIGPNLQPLSYIVLLTYIHAGAVKDSVVGEERLAQYLLAVLNTRKTPLHWERLNKEKTEESSVQSKESHGTQLRDSVPNRRRRVNDSDVHYIKVLQNYQLSAKHITVTYG